MEDPVRRSWRIDSLVVSTFNLKIGEIGPIVVNLVAMGHSSDQEFLKTVLKSKKTLNVMKTNLVY